MTKPVIEILHEDPAFLIVNKPPGVLTIPDRQGKETDNLQDYLHRRYGRIWTVHRLDRETSGVLCFARSAEAHRRLSQQFETRSVEKIYLALVDGIPFPREGVIDLPIGPHPSQPGKMIVSREGKPALTTYRVVELFQLFALVEAGLETGRTHQIRVHLAAAGHPLTVDPLYGKRSEFFLSEVKGPRYRIGKGQTERPLMTRATLHAHRLRIDHPETGERLGFEAPLPRDFSALLRQLGKWLGTDS